MGFRVLVLILVAAVPAATAQGKPYENDSFGFSLVVPEGWVVIDAAKVKRMAKSHPQLQRMSRGLDFSKVAMCAARPVQGRFAANFNVARAEERVPVTAEGKAKYRRYMNRELAKRGIRLENLEVDYREVSGTRCLRGVYQFRMPGRYGLMVKQMQVFHPVGGTTLVLTFSADVDGFEDEMPLFDGVLESFRAEESLATFWLGLARSVRWTLIGGAIGLVVCLLRWFMNRPMGSQRRPKSLTSEYTPFGGTYSSLAEDSPLIPDTPDFTPAPPDEQRADPLPESLAEEGEAHPQVRSRYEPPPWEDAENAELLAREKAARKG